MQSASIDDGVDLPHALLEARVVKPAVALHERRIAERILAPHKLRRQQLFGRNVGQARSHALSAIRLPRRSRSSKAGAIRSQIHVISCMSA